MTPTDPVNVIFVATSANAEHGRGGRRRIVDIARQAARFGRLSQIVCFLPFGQVLRGLGYLRSGKESLQNEAGVRVHYFPMLPLTRFAGVEALNIRLAGSVLRLIARRSHCRLIYGHGSRAAGIGLATKKRDARIRVIADFHGIGSSEYAYQHKAAQDNKTVVRLEEHEENVLEQADEVVMVSERMHTYLENKLQRSIPNAHIIPCAVESQHQPESTARQTLRERLHLADRFVFCYAGSAVSYQMPEQMCRLFESIRQAMPEAFFLILSQQGEVFRTYLEKLQVPAEDWLVTGVPHEKVFETLALGDVGLLLREDSLLNRVASPTKFGEYLLCGLPVILTPAAGDYPVSVQQYDLGFVIDENKLTADPDLLAFLNRVKAQRSEFALRCRSYAQDHLSWQKYGGVLNAVLESMQHA